MCSCTPWPKFMYRLAVYTRLCCVKEWPMHVCGLSSWISHAMPKTTQGMSPSCFICKMSMHIRLVVFKWCVQVHTNCVSNRDCDVCLEPQPNKHILHTALTLIIDISDSRAVVQHVECTCMTCSFELWVQVHTKCCIEKRLPCVFGAITCRPYILVYSSNQKIDISNSRSVYLIVRKSLYNLCFSNYACKWAQNGISKRDYSGCLEP